MDAADRAQPDQDAELANHLDATLVQVRSALDAPGSEICADCGEEIEPKRRAALPSATRCVPCQAYFERVLELKERNTP